MFVDLIDDQMSLQGCSIYIYLPLIEEVDVVVVAMAVEVVNVVVFVVHHSIISLILISDTAAAYLGLVSPILIQFSCSVLNSRTSPLVWRVPLV